MEDIEIIDIIPRNVMYEKSKIDKLLDKKTEQIDLLKKDIQKLKQMKATSLSLKLRASKKKKSKRRKKSKRKKKSKKR